MQTPNYKAFALLAILTGLVYACASVAYTNRKQLNLVPNSQLISMSAQQYTAVLGESKLSSDARQSGTIRQIGSKIQQAVEKYMNSQNRTGELEGYNWEFNLIENDTTVNAWCMPGGKVAFYTGILPICKDEQGIAVVMGHEVAHAIANHGRERMSQQMVAEYGIGALTGALNTSKYGPLLMQAVGMGSNLGLLKFSRDQESEADHLGLIFMTMAGYNPEAAPVFWERMAANSGASQTPEFLSTHPSHATRIADLKKWTPEAVQFKSN